MNDTDRLYPLEPAGAEMRALVEMALNRIVRHIESLPEQRAARTEPVEDFARSLRGPLPEQAAAPEAVMDFLFEEAIPRSFNTAGPGYLAYIPGGGIFHSAVADLIAAATNRYVGVWVAAPVLAELEAEVLRWFCGLVGYPSSALGILTSGGSLANFSAVLAARRERLPEDFLTGTIYASDQVHHSVTKAAALAGFPAANVRLVGSDGRFRVRVDEMEALIERDRSEGRHPFLLVGSAGTVNTGAVDDLVALAGVAERHGLWYHVDAAYGGFFVMTERGRKALRGIERADSITLDPHKGLFLPYGTGCLLARDVEALRRAHAGHGEYMPEMREEADLVDFCQISPELSRDFRGLRVWLPLKLVGAGAFRRALDEKLDLARWAWARLREIEGIEVIAEPELSLLAFRYRGRDAELEEANRLNREILAAINERGRVYLTGTTVRGQFVLRICVLSFRTHVDRLEMCLEDVREAVRSLGH